MSSEVQIYPPESRPKVPFFSLANLVIVLLTSFVALATAWTTVQVGQSETKRDLENFQSWAREQKIERNEKIENVRQSSEAGFNEVKQNFVRKDELQQQGEVLKMILDDTKYLRQRVDDLEIRKKNN